MVKLIYLKNGEIEKLENVEMLKNENFVLYHEREFITNRHKMMFLDCFRKKTSNVVIKMDKIHSIHFETMFNEYLQTVNFYLIFLNERYEKFLNYGEVININKPNKNLFSL